MRRRRAQLRSKDVAHLLDISPDEAIDLARRKKLRATKEGRFWRFSHGDVMVYKRRQERETPFSWIDVFRAQTN